MKGGDVKAAPCRGFASEACSTNAALRLECNLGACNNRALQRQAFLCIDVRPLFGDQWAAFLHHSGKAGSLMGEYVGEALTPAEFTSLRGECEK